MAVVVGVIAGLVGLLLFLGSGPEEDLEEVILDVIRLEGEVDQFVELTEEHLEELPVMRAALEEARTQGEAMVNIPEDVSTRLHNLLRDLSQQKYGTPQAWSQVCYQGECFGVGLAVPSPI